MTARTKIVVVGDDWPGSNVRFIARALERVGASVAFFGQDRILPLWRSLHLRLVNRALKPILERELALRLLETCQTFRPQGVLVAAGHLYSAATIARIQALDAKVACLYFDVPWRVAGSHFQHAIGQYDAVGSMRSWHEPEFAAAGARRFFLTRFGYCSESHFCEAPAADRPSVTHGPITFIGTAERPRDRYLEHLARHLPAGSELRIYGTYWTPPPGSPLVPHVMGQPVVHPAHMRKIYADASIALHFLCRDPSAKDPAMRRGDQHNSRSFQIPACGALMLAQHTEEHDRFFVNGKDYVSFTSQDDLVEQVHALWKDPERRNRIAIAGRRRAEASDYSYNPVAQQILDMLRSL